MAQFELNRTKDKSKIDIQPIKDGSAYFAVDEQSQSGDLYIDYDEKRYNVSGNVGYKKITTRGFEIIGWNGEHGKAGYYIIDYATEAEQEIPLLKGKKITLMNDMNVDSYCTIIQAIGKTFTEISDTGIELPEKQVTYFYVDKLYTNSQFENYNKANYNIAQKEDYKDKLNGNALGSIWNNYPDLGWMIKARENGSINYSQQACLFINDHPELGTFDWFQDSYALSAENGNLAQGKTSFAQGQDNKAYGKYSFASGKQNKVGYADTAFGRENDLSQGQNIFAAGFGNKAENIDAAAYSTMLGSFNISGKTRNKLIAGSYNNDKATNVFEIGNGSDDGRHNIFEIDNLGHIASNEKYLEGYELYKHEKFQFSSNELTNYLSPDYLTFEERQISEQGYGPYFILKNIANLQEEGWYIMQIKLTNNDLNQTLTLPVFQALERYDVDTEDLPGKYGFKPLSCELKPNESIILDLPIYLVKSKNGSPVTYLGLYGNDKDNIAHVVLDIEPIAVFKAKEIVMENVNKDYKYDIVTEKGTPCINGLSRNGIITTDKIYYKDTRDSLLFAIDQENSNKLLIFPSKAIIGSTVFPREAIYTSNILIDRLYSVIYQQQRIIDKLILNIADLEDRESSVHKLEINLLQPASDNQSLWEKVDNQSYYRYTVNLATNYYNGNTVTIIGYNVNDGEAIDKLALSKIVVGNNGIIADDNSFTLLSYGSLPLQSLNVTFIFMITPYCTTLEVK